MYVKYVMQSPTDYRGTVKLIVRNSSGQDLAYSAVASQDADMVVLVTAEIDLVKDATNGVWPDIREALGIEIDAYADDVRKLLRPPMAETVDVEYLQVETALNEWEAAGSDPNTVPGEVSVWATIKGETLEWAINDIRTAVTQLRTTIQSIRQSRLQGKENVFTAPDPDVENAYLAAIADLDTIKASILSNST